MQNLINFIENTENAEFKVTERVDGKRTIFQPQRNELRKQAEQKLYDDLKAAGFNVFMNKGLVAIVADNEEVGNITFQFKVSIADLDYEAADEEDAYYMELEDKQAEAEEKARIKAEKIKASEKKRAEKEARKQLTQDLIDLGKIRK